MKEVRVLTVDRCTISEIKIDDIASIRRETVSPLHNPINACFLSLSRIYLSYSKGLKELTWLMFAPKLAVLFVYGGDVLKDIVNKEKACQVEEKSGIVPFQNLKTILFFNLPELENIYWRPLPFPCLTEIYIKQCPKLRKLPLNCKSSSSGAKGLVIKYDKSEWLEGVEWEDEATKARFLPSCIQEVPNV